MGTLPSPTIGARHLNVTGVQFFEQKPFRNYAFVPEQSFEECLGRSLFWNTSRKSWFALQDTLGNFFYARTCQKEVALIDASPGGAQSMQDYIVTRLEKLRA